MAQPSVKKVQVIMVPDHSDAVYKLGEKVKLQVIALDCGVKLNDVEVKYQISKDLMPAHKEGALKLKGNEGVTSKAKLVQQVEQSQNVSRFTIDEPMMLQDSSIQSGSNIESLNGNNKPLKPDMSRNILMVTGAVSTGVRWNGFSATALHILFASIRASSDAVFGSIILISSPPYLQTISVALEFFFKVCATCLNTASPA